MAAHVRPYDLGCEPSPSVPAETLLQSGSKTFLLFFAVSPAPGPPGRLADLGVATVDCVGCVAATFGYPNDEGLREHPLYEAGIGEVTGSVLEVVDSPWAGDMADRMVASARRIWGGRGTDPDSIPRPVLRHFLVPLKEKTFECLAESLVVARYCATFDEAVTRAVRDLSAD